ncbi:MULTISPECIES: GNAT family N-acetyltransferase [unclassified Pseudoalteromonas]|uniref:GNAT family N-acetyltransferase n=1 Tax=unclassified Pseudoalteromonas TaxID=194690 RepID=UPI000403C431|nr:MULTISPECIES: GNAT family N-acetyltransferase [unclassified Pseudoalteromonas]
MSLTVNSYRKGSALSQNELEHMAFYAVSAMGPHNVYGLMQQSFFAEMIVSYNAGKGELYILSNPKNLLSFAFVLDKYNGAGVYHIHLVSTFRACRKKGYGSFLLDHIINKYPQQGITLETLPENIDFFKRNSFKIKTENLTHDFVEMELNASKKEGFSMVNMQPSVYDKYRGIFNDTAERLGY